MKLTIGLSVLFCVAAFGQHGDSHGGAGHPAAGGGHSAVGGGHIPARGPARASAPARTSTPARHQDSRAVTENHVKVDRQGHPDVPHVDAKNDRWVGHDSGARDAHYQLVQPWAHGHFSGGFGPQHEFILREETGNASGVTVIIGTSLRTITTSSRAGTGLAIKS